MLSHSGFIYKIIGIGFIFFYLLSCAPRPEIEWVPEIKSVSAKVSDWSAKGLAVDAGAIFRWNRLAFSVGVSSVSFRTCSATFGAGVCF